MLAAPSVELPTHVPMPIPSLSNVCFEHLCEIFSCWCFTVYHSNQSLMDGTCNISQNYCTLVFWGYILGGIYLDRKHACLISSAIVLFIIWMMTSTTLKMMSFQRKVTREPLPSAPVSCASCFVQYKCSSAVEGTYNTCSRVLSTLGSCHDWQVFSNV